MNSRHIGQHFPQISDLDAHQLVDERVSCALEEYAESLEKNQPLSRALLLKKYADVAEELTGCLDSLEFIRDIAPQISEERSGGDDAQLKTAQHRVTVGDYRIVREIGRGGMGVVYEAEQLSLGRSVALKVLPYAAMLDGKAITRFKNEARAAATLDHPHIVPVFAVGVERGIHYYAMSLIDGLTVAELVTQLQRSITDNGSTDRLSIDDFLGRRGDWNDKVSASHLEPTIDSGQQTKKSTEGSTYPADDTDRDVEAAISTQRSRFDGRYFRSVARMGADAANALDHAHQHGIVHRDIKPGNLMIDANTKLWVTDFGLARIESEAGMTMTGDLVGTLRYMAPEQALAKRIVVDHRADIYSLGASLYELLTLRPPFDAPSREMLLKQIAFEEPKPLQHANGTVPQDLQTIVHKALSKNPDDRYQTAAEMADDLLAFVNDEPIKARPLSMIQRVSRWAAKRKNLVASVAGVLILAVIGLLISNSLIVQQRNAAQAAEEKERAARREADSNAKLARETVDKYFTKVSENQLLNEPSMQSLRKELLTLALDYYDEFVQQQPDDPDLQTELADAYHRVGMITRDIGSIQKSIDAYTMGLTIRENLLANQSESLDYQLDVAISKRELAQIFLEAGQREKGLRYVQDAVATCEQLVHRKPDDLTIQRSLFVCYSTLYSAFLDRGSYVEALSAMQESIAGLQKLVYHHPKVLRLQSDLAGGYNNAGLAQSKLGRRDEAVNSFRRSIEILETLVAENPGTLEFQSNLGSAYHNLATIHDQLNETADALGLYQKAITIRERLADQSPDVYEYQVGLVGSYHNLGTLYRKLGETADASEMFKKAIANLERVVDRDPHSLEHKRRLASTYTQFAQSPQSRSDKILLHRKAIAIRESLLERDPIVGDLQGLVNSLCFLGKIYRVSGDPEAAVAAYTRVTGLGENVGERDKTTPGFWGLVGRAHYRIGNWRQARENLERCIELHGDKRPTLIGGSRWWYLTMTLHKLGEVKLARSYYDELVAEYGEIPNSIQASMRDEAAQVLGIE